MRRVADAGLMAFPKVLVSTVKQRSMPMTLLKKVTARDNGQPPTSTATRSSPKVVNKLTLKLDHSVEADL